MLIFRHQLAVYRDSEPSSALLVAVVGRLYWEQKRKAERGLGEAWARRGEAYQGEGEKREGM